MISWAKFGDIECGKRPDGHTTFCFWVLVINDDLRLFDFVKYKHFISAFKWSDVYIKKKKPKNRQALCTMLSD